MFENHHLDEFMEHHRFTGLTYDDVSLITQYADFLPSDADVSTLLTRNIRMSIPVVSAAMDTVTESAMGITMAMSGGIGIVHKNLEPPSQRAEVKRVKYYLNGFLAKARTLSPDMTIGDVEQLRREKGFRFSSFPVLDENRKLLGIVTESQFRYAESDDTLVRDLMVVNTVTAPPGTNVTGGVPHPAGAQDQHPAGGAGGRHVRRPVQLQGSPAHRAREERRGMRGRQLLAACRRAPWARPTTSAWNA